MCVFEGRSGNRQEGGEGGEGRGEEREREGGREGEREREGDGERERERERERGGESGSGRLSEIVGEGQIVHARLFVWKNAVCDHINLFLVL